MSKFNQKIVLFIEPADRPYLTPSKLGNLFMNRFAIEEDANHEILKIYHLEHTTKPSRDELGIFIGLEEGMDLINKGIIVLDS